MNKKTAKMIGIMSAILLATGCAFSQAQTTTPQNLIGNSGFEDGLNDWINPYPKEITETTEATHSGTKAMKIDTSVQNRGVYIVKTLNNVIGGAEYEFSVWARAPLGSKKHQAAAMKIETYSPKGGNTAGYSASMVVPNDGQWHQLKLRKRVLGDTTFCKLLLRAFNTYSVIYDDASFVMVSAQPEVVVMTPAKAVMQAGAKKEITYELALYSPWTNKELPQITARIAPQDANSGAGDTNDISASVTKVDDSHFNATVSIPALAATDYTVNFIFQREGKTFQTPYPAYLFTVPQMRKPNYLTDTGTLLWHGKPFFPIGMYHPTAGSVAKDGRGGYDEGYQLLAESGFNAVQGGSPVGSDGSLSLAGFKRSLDLAQKYGLAVDVPLYSGGKVKEILDKNLQAIKAFANDPAILDWKIYDEPLWKDINGGVAAEVPGAYRAIKAADPDNSIELTVMSEYDFWPNFCDIIQPDIYPLPRFPISLISERIQMATKDKLPWQNLQVALQCGYGDLQTQPTVAQARSMVYQAVIHGAKGIWWYSMHEGSGETEWRLAETPLWAHFKDINTEIKVLSEPLMLGKEVPIKSSDPEVQIAAREYQHKLYLLFTNPANKTLKTEFSLTGFSGVLKGVYLESKEPVQIENQHITLSLNPMQTDTMIFDLP